MPKGKTPSLIGSSLGRPRSAVAGKTSPCSRCHEDIAMGEKCYDVPQPQKKFASTRRFCGSCYRDVLEQTRRDLTEVEAL
ncbi:MAG: hypothetical protein U0263_31270 [Polyangiaceae bacterium]